MDIYQTTRYHIPENDNSDHNVARPSRCLSYREMPLESFVNQLKKYNYDRVVYLS